MKKSMIAISVFLFSTYTASYGQICQSNDIRPMSGVIFNQNPLSVNVMASDQALNFKSRGTVNTNQSASFTLGKANEVIQPGVITISNDRNSCTFTVSYNPHNHAICVSGAPGNNIACIATTLGSQVVLTIK